MITLLTGITALLSVLVITPLVQRVGLHLGFVDRPNHRKVHHKPIVRIGGVAVFISMGLALLVAYALGAFNQMSNSNFWQITGILVGGISFFLIGLADDVFNLSSLLRLGLQAIAVGLVWSMGIRVEHLPIPFLGELPTGWFSFPITFLWLAGVANAINWIDGLDGLMSGVSAIAAITLSLLCWQTNFSMVGLFPLAMAAAVLGFLYYNQHPARIFMGDGGSYLIGFVLAAVGMTTTGNNPEFQNLILPYLVLAVPLLDMVRVIVGRLLDGKSPLYGDQRHLHHCLLQAGLSTPAAVAVIWSLATWCGSWALTVAGLDYGLIAVGVSSLLLAACVQPLFSERFAGSLRMILLSVTSDRHD